MPGMNQQTGCTLTADPGMLTMCILWHNAFNKVSGT